MTRQPAPEERHLAALGARVVVAAAMVSRLSGFARAAAESAASSMDARDAARRALRAITGRQPTREERALYTDAERAQLTAGRAAYEWTALLCDWIDIAEHAAEDYSAARSAR